MNDDCILRVFQIYSTPASVSQSVLIEFCVSDLLSGAGGEPIDVYIHVEEMPQFKEEDDIKSIMMQAQDSVHVR